MNTTDQSNVKPVNEEKDENLDPISGAPGAHPVGVGVGAATAGATGAAIGMAAGPVGAAVGAAVGAVAGGLIGKGVAEAIDPTAEEAYWRDRYHTEEYYDKGLTYEDYQPAYRTGYTGYGKHGVEGRDFDAAEAELEREYNESRGSSRLEWEKAKAASRAAWDRAGRKPGEVKDEPVVYPLV